MANKMEEATYTKFLAEDVWDYPYKKRSKRQKARTLEVDDDDEEEEEEKEEGEFIEDANDDDDDESLKTDSPPGDGSNQGNLTGDATKQDNPAATLDTKPRRKEVVKKTRVEREDPPPKTPSPARLPSPVFKRRSPQPSRSPSPSPTPSIATPPLPDFEFDAPEVPDLPTLGDEEPEPRKQKAKFMVQAPPAMKEGPKRRKAPPRVKLIPKNLSRHRKTRPAEAPVTQEELLDIRDPLDFLAKYCIINPDRLPFYEIIFESSVAEQSPRYVRPEPKKKTEKEGEGVEGKENKENEEGEQTKEKGKKKKKRSKSSSKDDPNSDTSKVPSDLLNANRGMGVRKTTMTVGEQYLEKLLYTLDLLHDKMTTLGQELGDLEAKRVKFLASRAKELFPEVTVPDYTPKVKGKGKGKKKDKKSTQTPPPRRLRPDEITNDVIVSRLDDKMITELSQHSEIRLMQAEMDRLKERMGEMQQRVEEIASEKLLTDAFCMNHYFLRQGLPKDSNPNQQDGVGRQNSELYQRLHPSPDFEMNLDEVEGALQQVNNHLMTEKELFFLYNILDLPNRERINFRLFSIIAALSEKVTQLDPVIKKLINNVNYNALDIKMEKCKELFDLLEAADMPSGAAQAQSLAVELTAGGLRPEHTHHVLHKFNRENRGVIDFLDFVTYVPLFVEIHKRIISDPLRQERDL